MDKVMAGLHASRPERLSFAPTVEVRAFLLERPRGNLLIYDTPILADEAEALDRLGGVARRYLGHWHEVALGGDRGVAARISAPLFCHASERAAVAEHCPVDTTFTDGHRLGEDFEAIPIPGHTRGSTAYRWDSGQHRCLFTADSVYLRDGEWIAAVLEGSSDRQAYIESLERLKDVDFDVLVPWAATRGQPFHTMTNRSDARRRLDAIIDRLHRGEDH